MKKLANTFKVVFDIPFSMLPLPDFKLYPIGNSLDKALLFGSSKALKKLFLVQGHINHFAKICPKGYFLLGFWGHGVNSYAFYYSRCDEWSKIFFRLPYGGAYMDNRRAASEISNFISKYSKFEKRVRNRGFKLLAIDSMNEAQYRLESSDGKKFEHKKSLLSDANFSKIFKI